VNTVKPKLHLIAGLLAGLLFSFPVLAEDATEADCTPRGAVTLKTGSGISIELDGENGGCNADGSRFSFGNVIGSVRIFPGEWAIIGSQFVELTLDEPFAFERYRHPFVPTVERYIAQFETREGIFVFISMTPVRQPGTLATFNTFELNEFIVRNSSSFELGENVIYQEYDRIWSISAPLDGISGTLANANSNSSEFFPVGDREVALFNCRDSDGLVATTTTDSEGQFRFDGEELGLFDGNYQLRFPEIPGFSISTNRFTIFSNNFTNCADFSSPDNRRTSFSGRSSELPINVFYSADP